MDSICLDPEQPALEARHLDALIERWLAYHRKRLAARTAAGYAEKIEYFRDWWRSSGEKYHWRLDEDALLDFNAHLSERVSRFGKPLGYHTRRDCLRRLRQMLLWAHEKNHIGRNYGKLVPAPTGSAPMRTAAPLDQLRRLINATDLSPYPTRDRAILAVLLGTGVRRAECASINIEWVQMNADGSGELQVEAKKVGQRDVHRRLVAFDQPTGQYIRAHLDTQGTKGPLFVSGRSGRRLKPIGVYRAIKRLIVLAKLEDQIQGPHDLRRNFTTYYSRHRRGESHGQLLSKQLGHSSYRMTASYSLQDVEDVREAIISPFALLAAGKS